MIIVEDQPTAQFFVASGIILIICFSVLLLIFVPKYLVMHDMSETSHRPATSVVMNGREIRVGGGSTHVTESAPKSGGPEQGQFSSAFMSSALANSANGLDTPSEEF